jgi:hypothetical protein
MSFNRLPPKAMSFPRNAGRFAPKPATVETAPATAPAMAEPEVAQPKRTLTPADIPWDDPRHRNWASPVRLDADGDPISEFTPVPIEEEHLLYRPLPVHPRPVPTVMHTSREPDPTPPKPLGLTYWQMRNVSFGLPPGPAVLPRLPPQPIDPNAPRGFKRPTPPTDAPAPAPVPKSSGFSRAVAPKLPSAASDFPPDVDARARAAEKDQSTPRKWETLPPIDLTRRIADGFPRRLSDDEVLESRLAEREWLITRLKAEYEEAEKLRLRPKGRLLTADDIPF